MAIGGPRKIVFPKGVTGIYIAKGKATWIKAAKKKAAKKKGKKK